MTTDNQLFTSAELHALLKHPDGMVRSLADWSREYRGEGWRILNGHKLTNVVAADDMQFKLRARLIQLGEHP